MDVSWAGRADPGNVVASTAREVADFARPSLLYQPVEIAGEDEDALAAQALADYDNAIIIELRADYYRNWNVNARPDRLRKRLRVISGF